MCGIWMSFLVRRRRRLRLQFLLAGEMLKKLDELYANELRQLNLRQWDKQWEKWRRVRKDAWRGLGFSSDEDARLALTYPTLYQSGWFQIA